MEVGCHPIWTSLVVAGCCNLLSPLIQTQHLSAISTPPRLSVSVLSLVALILQTLFPLFLQEHLVTSILRISLFWSCHAFQWVNGKWALEFLWNCPLARSCSPDKRTVSIAVFPAPPSFASSSTRTPAARRRTSLAHTLCSKSNHPLPALSSRTTQTAQFPSFYFFQFVASLGLEMRQSP